jgi:hypothetical protein
MVIPFLSLSKRNTDKNIQILLGTCREAGEERNTNKINYSHIFMSRFEPKMQVFKWQKALRDIPHGHRDQLKSPCVVQCCVLFHIHFMLYYSDFHSSHWCPSLPVVSPYLIPSASRSKWTVSSPPRVRVLCLMFVSTPAPSLNANGTNGATEVCWHDILVSVFFMSPSRFVCG